MFNPLEPRAPNEGGSVVAAGARKSHQAGTVPYTYLLLHQFPDGPTEKCWREFLARVRFPAHYDSPEFFLEPYWRDGKLFAILLLRGDRVVGTLTGLVHGWYVASGLGSRPQLCFDEQEDSLVASQAIADALVTCFPDAKLFTVYAWGPIGLPGLTRHGFRMAELPGDVVVDLRPGAESIFDNFPLNRRRDIRKALRNQIEVAEAATDADMEAYWRVYCAWKQTDRKRIHHNRDFAMLAAVQKMSSNHRRFLARYRGEVIAASGIRFYAGGLVEYSNNCSLDAYLHLRPNDLLVWKIIEWSCEHGFSRLSMGGAQTFLRKWSNTIIPINRYQLDRTFLHRVEFKEEASAKVRQLTHHLPIPVQGAIRNLFRVKH